MKEEYENLLEDSKSYLKTRYDLLRLELLDKLSLILGLLVLIIVSLFVLLASIAFFSVALVGWLTKCMPMSVACCVLGGLLLLMLLIIYLMRYKIFINPFVKILSKRLFSPNEIELANEDVNETTT